MTEIICGIDEAGRGSSAGPMIVAAVALYADQVLDGVRDSKKVKSDEERDLLFKRIDNASIWRAVRQVEPAEIDGLGIGTCWKEAVASLILECQDAIGKRNPLVIIDGKQLVRHPEIRLKVKAIVKADTKIQAVSAASIMAKFGQVCWAYGCAARNAAMHGSDHYGFRSNRGYGTSVHLDALAKYGLINGEHRRTFIKDKRLPKLRAHG